MKIYDMKESKTIKMDYELEQAKWKLIEYLDTILYQSRFKNEDSFFAFVESIYVNLIN